jgi:aldehyde:ferredoxin oxidoreductase
LDKILEANLKNQPMKKDINDENFTKRFLGGLGFTINYLLKELKNNGTKF